MPVFSANLNTAKKLILHIATWGEVAACEISAFSGSRKWFSFFHEAAHVLYDNKKDLLINDGSQDDPREKRANKFAAEFLIPSKYNDAISRFRSKDEILRMANKFGIAPGIVAGRYQFLTKNWSYFRDLIRDLE